VSQTIGANKELSDFAHAIALPPIKKTDSLPAAEQVALAARR
jgi:hypothetical protein